MLSIRHGNAMPIPESLTFFAREAVDSCKRKHKNQNNDKKYIIKAMFSRKKITSHDQVVDVWPCSMLSVAPKVPECVVIQPCPPPEEWPR